MKDSKNPYALLSISKHASDDDIKKAYLDMIKVYNPEDYPDKFIIIRQAFETLKEPAKRAVLDVYIYNLVSSNFKFGEEVRQVRPFAELDQEIAALSDDQAAQKIPLLLIRAYNAVKKRSWQIAAQSWEEILRLDPGNLNARLNLFNVYAILGYSYAIHHLTSDALELWEKALNLQPDCTELIHNLALAYEEEEKNDKSRMYWRAVLKQWQEKLNVDPADAYVKEMLVELHRHFGGQLEQGADGTGEQAIEEYREILKINPDDPVTRKKVLQTLMKERNWKEAITEVETLIKDSPDDPDLYGTRGWVLLNAGDMSGAFMNWKKAIKKFPQNTALPEHIVKAYLTLAEKYREKHQLNSALVQLKSALKYKPNDEKILFQLGVMYESQGKVDWGINYYEKVLEISPKHSEAKTRLIKARMKR